MAFREGDKLKRCDVAHIATDDLPGQATLAWASFLCQDLSLAGTGAGLNGERSGTFHYFWDLIEQLQAQERQPRIVALENVVGALTSHSGKDFQTILERMATTGYRTGALVIDAVHFLPQSRPRLFIVGVREDCDIPVDLISQIAGKAWHTKRMQQAFQSLPVSLQSKWIWWNVPRPNAPVVGLSTLLLTDEGHTN